MAVPKNGGRRKGLPGKDGSRSVFVIHGVNKSENEIQKAMHAYEYLHAHVGQNRSEK
jgi:hypothetical protein